jgi:hypothetical protein
LFNTTAPNRTSPNAYIGHPKSYCANPTSLDHAAVSYASDSFDLVGCQDKCTELSCTCFDFSAKTAPQDTCSAADFTFGLDGLQCHGLKATKDSMATAVTILILQYISNAYPMILKSIGGLHDGLLRSWARL